MKIRITNEKAEQLYEDYYREFANLTEITERYFTIEDATRLSFKRVIDKHFEVIEEEKVTND